MDGAIVKRIWRAISGYVWWTHERGSLQYDVMVTLILAFIFLAPLWINFKDKPAERTPHPTEVVVYPDGQGVLVYEIGASAIHGNDDDAIRAGLLRVVEPIAGEVELVRYEKVYRGSRLVSYRAWVNRQ
jgi:hypothetical protein